MSTIHDLPLMSLKAFATPDEDLLFGVGFSRDGAPVDLSALDFTLKIGGVATLATDSAALRVIGPNLICFVPAAAKLGWPSGPQTLSLLAQDATYSRALLFASSFKTVAAPSPAQFGFNGVAATAAALTPDQIDALLTAQAAMLTFSRTFAFLLA